MAAARMARRGILTLVGTTPGQDLTAALAACDALEQCAREGQGWHARLSTFDAGLAALPVPLLNAVATAVPAPQTTEAQLAKLLTRISGTFGGSPAEPVLRLALTLNPTAGGGR